MNLPGPVDDWIRKGANAAYPGDSAWERATSMVDGRSPLSPLHGPRELAGVAVDGVSGMDTNLCGPAEPICLGVKGTTNVAKGVARVDSFVSNDVPGGWMLVAALILFLLLRAMRGPAKAAKKATKKAAVTAGSAYVATNYPRTAHAFGVKAPVRMGAHKAQSGRTEFVSERTAKTGRSAAIEVCVDTGLDVDTAVARRRRGWNVQTGGRASAPCPDNGDKTHHTARMVKP